MKPEEKAEVIICGWLMEKGRSIEKIYFNRKNKYLKEFNGGIFKVKGLKNIPDILLRIDNGFGKEYYAIEVKDCSKSKNVLDGSKIIDLYFENYIKKKTKYLVEGKEVNINGFLIATQSSPKGYLFGYEAFRDNIAEEGYESKYLAAKKYEIIPRFEGDRTFEFVRTLWNQYSRIRKNYDKEYVSIGILIGDANKNNVPKIMITKYNKNKRRWGQAFWEI